ncbi:hypothetical protein CDD83_8978 [Cordyceps sp. RAO-2017]|nr:hypothetical protein CDD83_8978 [Cordyceps sp. RAO-2017]
MAGRRLVALTILGLLHIAEADENEVIRGFMASLQKGVTIDWTKAPRRCDPLTTETPCFDWSATCAEIKFSICRELSQTYPSLNYGGRLITSVPEITVYSKTLSDEGAINAGEDDIALTNSQSKTELEGETTGWQADATLSTGLAGMSISVGNYGSVSSGTQVTHGISVSSICAPGHDCHFQTRVFFVKIVGHCRAKPMVECDQQYDACRVADQCDQIMAFREKRCLLGSDATSRYPHEPCELHVPVRDANGKLVSRYVRLPEKIPPPPERPPPPTPARTMPRRWEYTFRDRRGLTNVLATPRGVYSGRRSTVYLHGPSGSAKLNINLDSAFAWPQDVPASRVPGFSVEVSSDGGEYRVKTTYPEVKLAASPEGDALFAAYWGHVVWLDASSLAVKWRAQVPARRKGTMSLLHAGGWLYVTTPGEVFRLNPNEPSDTASNFLDDLKFEEVRLAATKGGAGLIVGTYGTVLRLDPTNLKTLWETKVCDSGPVSVVSGGATFAGCGGYVYKIRESDGAVLETNHMPWMRESGREVRLALSDDASLLHVGMHGWAVGLAAQDLREVYRTSLPGGRPAETTALSAGQRAYYASQGIVFELDSKGVVIGSYDLSERSASDARLSMLDGTLYIGTGAYVVALEPVERRPDEVAESSKGDEGRRPKAVYRDGSDGTVYLDNGLWYDPRDRSYQGERETLWYCKPDAPEPDLSAMTGVRDAPAAAQSSSGDPGEVVRALRKSESTDRYLLEDGRWYDPETGMYYGGHTNDWYCDPGRPAPDLSVPQAGGPRQPGMSPDLDCERYIQVRDGEGCDTVADRAGVDRVKFIEWNSPQDPRCGSLWGRRWACVSARDAPFRRDEPGAGRTGPERAAGSEAKPGPRSASEEREAPTSSATTGSDADEVVRDRADGPTLPSIPAGLRCTKYIKVRQAEGCDEVAARARVDRARFQAWNSPGDANCYYLWPDYWACASAIEHTRPLFTPSWHVLGRVAR